MTWREINTCESTADTRLGTYRVWSADDTWSAELIGDPDGWCLQDFEVESEAKDACVEHLSTR